MDPVSDLAHTFQTSTACCRTQELRVPPNLHRNILCWVPVHQDDR